MRYRPDQPIEDTRFAVIDVETTGLYPSVDRIVEVAVVVIDSRGGVDAEFETLVNPNRDVGPTSIHGITAGMVSSAPRFEEIAGDLLVSLHDAVWAGHNVAFDLRFLKAEFARVGLDLPEPPSLCTMRLFGCLGPSCESHKLIHVCSACGVTMSTAHSALGDARAAAGVLSHLLRESRDFEISTLADLASFGLTRVDQVSVDSDAPELEPSGRTLTRQQAVNASISTRGSYISDLVKRLKTSVEEDTSEWPIGLYLNLLDRVLEDRRIDESEKVDITRLAQEWALSKNDAERAHRIHLKMLVDTALSDGVITDAEMADLEAVADLLAVPRDELNDLIEGAKSPVHIRDFADMHDDKNLVGCSVCFTGETPGPAGDPVSRHVASRIAEEAGLSVQRNVTKKLDLLVVADPDTQSGKARKARQYGIRIVAAPVFWQKLGVS